MRERLIESGLFFLNPQSRFEFALKLLALCSMTTLLSMGTELLIGSEISNPISTYFLIVFVISAPFFSIAMAITQRTVRLQLELQRVANTDEMTGLMNRRAFLKSLETVEEGAMLIIDADHFKAINDRYGHPVGDAVLVALADHLRRNFRTGDLIARIGGEEFAIYLVGADSSEIDVIGERVCKGFVLCNDVVPAPIKVTMSIGAAFAAMSSDMLELTERADQALYEAKQSGRARLNFWQPIPTGRS